MIWVASGIHPEGAGEIELSYYRRMQKEIKNSYSAIDI